MKNIIIGNGIDIQFGGLEYTNKSIIERALNNLNSGNFSEDVYPHRIGTWIETLHSSIPDILEGLYDHFAVFSDEKELISFKKNYTQKVQISEVSFEDYFFLNNLYCIINRIPNPKRFEYQEYIRRLFLDSIYNNGKINTIKDKFPIKVIEFIESYDNVFTTNYDRNLELATKKEILYLHGAFHILDDLYNPVSFRNQLSDRPFDNYPINKKFKHVYSTAITGNSGIFKDAIAKQAGLTNSFLDGLVEQIPKNLELQKLIVDARKSDNQIVKNLIEGIDLKKQNPKLENTIHYSIERLRDITGTFTFLGLSPNNDSHLIKAINENEKIHTIEYFYYSNNEADSIKSLFGNKEVKVLNVTDFWNKTASA